MKSNPQEPIRDKVLHFSAPVNLRQLIPVYSRELSVRLPGNSQKKHDLVVPRNVALTLRCASLKRLCHAANLRGESAS